MAEFKITYKALEDLNSIWEYTFYTWSEEQADSYYLMLIDTCNFIVNNPEIGKNHSEIKTDLYGLRATKHIIFYRKINDHQIEITRILHEKMDLKNKFNS